MMQPWQRNVLINKYIADSKLYELNEMIDSNRFDENQKQLMQEEANNLESYIEICTKRLEGVDPVDIARVYDEWSRQDDNEDKKFPYRLSRRSIIQEAFDRCMEEMFNKSQPAGSYEEYVRKARMGEITENDRVYEWHYLSQEEYKYILDKYIDAYGMRERWTDYVNTVINYFKEDAAKDKWFPERTDEDGFRHPGYRGYEHLPHFANVIEDIINKKGVNDKEDINVIAKAIYDAVIQRIEYCRDFYKFDREESGFHMSIAMGPSPTCNKESVIEYWKDKGVDLEIVDRDPDKFWEIDEYGEDYEDDEEYEESIDEDNEKPWYDHSDNPEYDGEESIDIDEDMPGEYKEIPEDKNED